MSDQPNNETHARILDAAEQLFAARGYAAVTLRDIGTAVGMKHASLYYYAPEGKKQLYREVMLRTFRRHRAGLEAVIAGADDQFKAQIYAVVRWLVSQPPLDLAHMAQSDMHALGENDAAELMAVAFNTFRAPLVGVLRRAKHRGLISVDDLSLAALALVTLVQSLQNVPGIDSAEDRERLGLSLADMLLNGWLVR